MLTIRLKYYLFCSLLPGVFCLNAQEPNDNNQAVITIIGNDPSTINNTHDFINTDPYQQTKEPPSQDQKLLQNQNIEPTLENGFHMRFEVSYSLPSEQRGGASSYSSNDDGTTVKKRGVRITEHSINAKKRLKRWFPARKKKYRPTLCGRF